MFQIRGVSTEPTDTTVVAAASLLAHHVDSPRIHEPGSNPESFQGRMISGNLVFDYEYGESPNSGMWSLRLAIYWEGESVFHASKRSIADTKGSETTKHVVHFSKSGEWRTALLTFVSEKHHRP